MDPDHELRQEVLFWPLPGQNKIILSDPQEQQQSNFYDLSAKLLDKNVVLVFFS